MEFEDFSKLYDTLVRERSIAAGHNNKQWFNHCVENHQELAKILGDWTVLLDTKLETTKGVAPERVAGPKIDSILKIIPTYLQKYSMSREQLKKPMLTKPRKIRTSKHLMGYASRSELDPDKTLSLSKEVAELGQIWEDSKNSCDTQKVVMSFDPRAFIHLGCSGLNSGSCWRTGGAKFVFGAIKNSFCFYVPVASNDQSDQEDILWGYKPTTYTKQYHMRGIGWIDTDKQTICLSNTYGNAKYCSYTYLSSIWIDIYRHIFGIKEDKEVYTCNTGSTNPPVGQCRTLGYLNANLVSIYSDKKLNGQKIINNFWAEGPPSKEEFRQLRDK